MNDGSLVVVQTDKSLPAAVVAEVQAKAAAAQATATTEFAKIIAVQEATNELSYDTGKKIIGLDAALAHQGDNDPIAVWWCAPDTGLPPQTTRAAQEAAITAWIAGQPDAANYERIVFPNGH